jgi:hypothetical protein
VLSSFDWRDKIESSHGLPKIDLLMKRRSAIFTPMPAELNYVQRKHTTTDRPCLTAVGIGTNATCRLHRAMSAFRGNPEDICSQ